MVGVMLVVVVPFEVGELLRSLVWGYVLYALIGCGRFEFGGRKETGSTQFSR